MLARVSARIRMWLRILAFRARLRNWREVWRGLLGQTRGLTLHFRNGLIIRGGARDNVSGIFNEIFVEHCYTPGWFYRPKAGDTVLDVGANIGGFSLYLGSTAPGIRVLAFEPHPETFGWLTRNIAENRLESTVMARRLAVGRGPGVVRFSGATGVDSGHEAASSTGEGEDVEAIGLAEGLALAEGRPIDLLKVDTEGAEVEIIAHAPAEVWPRIARVVVEYHDLAKRDEVVRTLEGAGYRCRVVPAPGYEHHLGLIYARRS